jgi:hypothetical protein
MLITVIWRRPSIVVWLSPASCLLTRGMEAPCGLPGITAHTLEKVKRRRGDANDVYDWKDQSTELKDLITMATRANRWRSDEATMGLGDMISASWDRNCSPARHGKYCIQRDTTKEHPGLGNYLLMVRARAGRQVFRAARRRMPRRSSSSGPLFIFMNASTSSRDSFAGYC